MFKMSFILSLLFVSLAASALTPAERAIRDARSKLAASTQKSMVRPAAHNALAMALARRARETGDPDFYDQALHEINAALNSAPNDFAAARTRAWVLLGKHEFATARTEAEALQRRAPDDLMVYAMLVDAYVELGDYDKAEQAAQWLLDLRPGNVAGLTRAAYLRELFGDGEGAIQLMMAALQAVPFDETEQRAWILSHLARLHLYAGRVEFADRVVQEALAGFPGYHYALGELIEIRLAQSRINEAVAAARTHYQAVPHPENRYRLAKLLQRNASVDESQHHFELFLREARAESAGWDNANRELIKHLLDEHDDPAAALTLAEQEIARRRDVFTMSTYAWTLHRNGQSERAHEVIKEALQVGVRDAQVLYDAGFIAAAAGDKSAAEVHWRDALRIAPWASQAAAVRARLETKVADASWSAQSK